jgi:hypothetical protein
MLNEKECLEMLKELHKQREILDPLIQAEEILNIHRGGKYDYSEQELKSMEPEDRFQKEGALAIFRNRELYTPAHKAITDIRRKMQGAGLIKPEGATIGQLETLLLERIQL